MFGNKDDKIKKAIEKGKPEVLIKMLGEKSEDIRISAIEALGKIKGDVSYNALISLIRDASAKVRIAAVKALGELGDPKARAHIDHQIAAEKDEKVQADMRAALSKVHTNE